MSSRERDLEATQDPADMAANAYTKELLISMSANDRGLLTQIDEALLRIEAGKFGDCVNCGSASVYVECEAQSQTLVGFKVGTGNTVACVLDRCVGHDCAGATGDGFRVISGTTTFLNCVADKNGNHGFAIVGVNGAGKTSLLKLLVGETKPDAGSIVVGQTVAPAYLSQHVTELPPRARVLEAVQDVARIARIGNQEISASTLAERFGFAANRQWTPVGDLSGGERRRLQLLRLLMAEPNVLVLDEPDVIRRKIARAAGLCPAHPGAPTAAKHQEGRFHDHEQDHLLQRRIGADPDRLRDDGRRHRHLWRGRHAGRAGRRKLVEPEQGGRSARRVQGGQRVGR